MSLLTPSDPAGCRAISLQPLFIKPTLTPGLLTCHLVLPYACKFWMLSWVGNWATNVHIIDGTQVAQGATIQFSAGIPVGGEMLFMVHTGN